MFENAICMLIFFCLQIATRNTLIDGTAGLQTPITLGTVYEISVRYSDKRVNVTVRKILFFGDLKKKTKAFFVKIGC